MKSKLILGAIASLLFVTPEYTHSQVQPLPGYANLSAAELGARLCVNEGTWRALDCAAILHIRRRSMRANEDFKTMLIRLHGDESRDRRGRARPLASLRSNRALELHPRDGRPWIGDLTRDGHEPRHWRTRSEERDIAPPVWDSGYRAHWVETVAIAQGVIDGTVADPCRMSPVVPNTWGNRGRDHNRAISRGFEIVHCGSTANEYWRQ